MPFAIDKQGSLDLTGTTGEYEFDVAAHPATKRVYVARVTSGQVRLRAWNVGAEGQLTSFGTERIVGSGTRTQLVVFDNHRIVVAWLDPSSTLHVRAYTGSNSGIAIEGDPISVESTITSFNLIAVGVTTGVLQGSNDTSVYYAYRHFALTTISANGGWKLLLGTVQDSADLSLGPVAAAGSGDKVSLSCAGVNEYIGGARPRKVLTLYRDAGQIKARSWRVAGAGVTSLATAAEAKPLGTGTVHGMSVTQNNDVFATVVWPGASNGTSRLQLLSVATSGTVSAYASAEINEHQPVFARLRSTGTDVAVAYLDADFRIAVAAWRLAAPGSGAPMRIVMASSSGLEMPTQFRLATMVPQGVNDPVKLFTLSRVASGKLWLTCWDLRQKLVSIGAGGGGVGVGPKMP